MTEINFKSDITPDTIIYTKIIKINNADVNLNMSKFKSLVIADKISQWHMCLGMLGKITMFKTKEIMKVIYCLLSDSDAINSINDKKLDLDLYDFTLNRFIRIVVVNDTKRDIKLKMFNVYFSLIIFDCKDDSTYKIYELYNIRDLKKYFDKSKVNFDEIVRLLKMKPKFTGKYNNIKADYKKLSVDRIILNRDDIIDSMQEFTKLCTDIEKKILCEYNKFYKIMSKYPSKSL